MSGEPLQASLDRKEKIMYIVAGCNGAGKTTAFKQSLHEILGAPSFINPDAIAAGLKYSSIQLAQRIAARITLEQIHAFLSGDESFCVETTLASRIYQSHIREAHKNGFKVALFYYWLNSPDLAVARVGQRVSEGGHDIPEETIRKRYLKSVKYLSQLYLPKVDYWKIVDNSGFQPKEIAASATVVKDRALFNQVMAWKK